MVQLSYTFASSVGNPGDLAAGGDHRITSRRAQNITPFGVGVVQVPGTEDACKLPGANSVVITDDGGTFTAGNIAATVNGVTVTSGTYDTNKATTMAALATAIQALAFVTSATYASGSDTITVVGTAQVHLTITVSVAAVTGDMTISSIVGSSTDYFLGISTKQGVVYGNERLVWNDSALMTLSGDTITTSDTVDGTFNGVAIATVTYATSEAVTLQLVANAIKVIEGVADAVVSGRTITVTNNAGLEMKNASLTVTDDTVASVSPTFAATYSRQSSGINSTDVVMLPSEQVGIERQGEIFLRCEEAITLGDTLYTRVNTGTGSQLGAFRNDADSGTCVAITSLRAVRNSVLAADGSTHIVHAEINLP